MAETNCEEVCPRLQLPDAVRPHGALSGNQGERVEQVIILKQDEVVRLNPHRLEQLYLQLGEAGAEDILCRALEELSARLSQTEKCYREGRLADMRKCARSLVGVADQIGMHLLSHVATDVAACADSRDLVAIAATLSRLLRVGSLSLNEICYTEIQPN